jgi:uncharacterized protein (TIGR02284 family)
MNPGNSASGDSPEAVQQLNSLLRGEISACETYRMAIDKIQSGDQISMDNASILREIERDHGVAAQQLRQRIEQLGGEASNSSGAWGTWAQAVQGTMNLFGDTSALKSLKEGEEHGLKDLSEALDDSGVDTASRELIASQLIPQQQRHVGLIDQLMNVTARS